MNRAVMIGWVGREPYLSTTPKGSKVAYLTIVVPMPGEDNDEWISVRCWGKLAERVEREIPKGSQISVDGRVEFRKVRDKYGVDQLRPEVIADYIELLN